MAYTGTMRKTGWHIDVRCALLVLFGYSVGLLLVGGSNTVAGGWPGLALFAVGLGAGMALLRTRLTDVVRVGLPLYALFAFVALAHIPQDLQSGQLTGLFYALRLLMLAMATLAVGLSYDDAEFARAFQWLLRPLRGLRVPVDDIACMTSIALRFIPESMNELNRVKAAQASRGAAFDSGGAVARTFAYGRMFVPVLAGLFRRAATLAEAMESRCYGAGPRTSLNGSGVPKRQLLASAAVCITFVALGAAL